MSDPFTCGGDAAAYVLGALDSHEISGFQRHLESCSVCQADVESLEQLVNVLPMSAPQYPASRQLRKRVMAEVRADVLATAERETSARTWNVPNPLRALGQMPRYGPGLVGLATAVALVLVVVVVGLTASGSKQHLTKTPGAHEIVASVGSAALVISGDHGQLLVHHLKPLSSRRTYEVWLKPPSGSPQPTGALFNVSPSGDSAVPIPESLKGISEVMVTQEPAGGKAVPTTKPVVVARIS